MVTDESKITEAELTDEQRCESASLLLDQTRYLLDDELNFAEVLRGSRKTISGLLLIVIGIGFFRMDLFGDKEQVPLIPVWAIWTIRSLFTLATFMILYGTWKLYSDRPIRYKEVEDKVLPGLEKGKTSASLSVLDLERHYRKILEECQPYYVMRVKNLIYGLAYRRLARANRRVRYRVESGKKWIFLGLILVFLGFLFYIWTVGEGLPKLNTDNDNNSQTTQDG